MARLTWEQVAAPQIDLRNLSLAGQTITSSFDRLSQMLMDRYSRQKTEATDAAIAEQLALTDPEQVGKVDLTKLDSKVDKRALLEAAHTYQNQLINTLGAKEDLLNKQAATALGPEMLDLLVAARNGDVDAATHLQAKGLTNPDTIGRALGVLAPQLFGAFTGGQEFRETARVHDANIANDNARIGLERQRVAQSGAELALRREELNLNRSQKQDVIDGSAFGQRKAIELGPMTPTEAAATLLQDPEFNKFSPAKQQAALAVLTTRQPVVSEAVATELRSAATPVGDPKHASEYRQLNTISQSIAPKVDANKLITGLVDSGAYQNPKAARQNFEYILGEVPQATMSDIAAAIQLNGADAGFFSGRDDKLLETVRGMVVQRKADQSSARLLELQQRMLSYTARNASVPPELLRKYNQLREEAGLEPSGRW